MYGYAASTTPTRAKTFTVRVLTAPSVRRGWQSAPNARRTVSRRSRSAASNSCPSASPGLSFRRAAATAATHGMTAAAALSFFFAAGEVFAGGGLLKLRDERPEARVVLREPFHVREHLLRNALVDPLLPDLEVHAGLNLVLALPPVLPDVFAEVPPDRAGQKRPQIQNVGRDLGHRASFFMLHAAPSCPFLLANIFGQ